MKNFSLATIIPTIKEGPFLLETVKSVAVATRTIDVEVYIFQNGHNIENKALYETEIKGLNWVSESRLDRIEDSWNRCIELTSNFDLIHLLHDDDFIHADFYRKMLILADGNETAGLLACGVLQVDEFSCPKAYKPFNAHYSTLSRSPAIVEASTNIFECPGVIVFKKNIREEKLFSGSFKLLMDWDAWAKLTLKYGAVQTPEILAYYRIHQNSISSSIKSDGRDLIERVRFYKKYNTCADQLWTSKNRIAVRYIHLENKINHARASKSDFLEILNFIGFFLLFFACIEAGISFVKNRIIRSIFRSTHSKHSATDLESSLL